MIINTSDIKHIYLATGYVDMRKSIDGLALIVSMEFDLDVMNGSLFIFTNRARNRIKCFIMILTDFGCFSNDLNRVNSKFMITLEVVQEL